MMTYLLSSPLQRNYILADHQHLQADHQVVGEEVDHVNSHSPHPQMINQ